MQKILFAITQSEFGGAQSHVAELLTGFRDKYKMILVTNKEGPLTRHAKKLDADVHLVPSFGRSVNPLGDLAAIDACHRLFASLVPDIIHLHSSKAGLVGRLAAHTLKIPVIYTAHGWGFKHGVPLLRRCLVWTAEKLAYRLTRCVICVSEYDRQLALRMRVGKPDKFVTIWNGIGDSPLRAEPRRSPVTIAMTARFQEPKDQAALIRALHTGAFDKVRIEFIGSGPREDECRNVAESLGLAGKVKFWGDQQNVDTIISNAQIFALISRYEGLPVSIIEAMRAGLPVLASAVGGVPELVRENESGLLVRDTTVDSISAAIKVLVESPDVRARFGAVGRSLYEKNFSASRMLCAVTSVYNRTLAESGHYS